MWEHLFCHSRRHPERRIPSLHRRLRIRRRYAAGQTSLGYDMRGQQSQVVDLRFRGRLPDSLCFRKPWGGREDGIYRNVEISGQRGCEIKAGLDYIKTHLTPPACLLRNTPSPRPENATLLSGWHASEVALLDAGRQHRNQDLSWWSSLQPAGAGVGGDPLVQNQEIQQTGFLAGVDTQAALSHGPQAAVLVFQ